MNIRSIQYCLKSARIILGYYQYSLHKCEVYGGKIRSSHSDPKAESYTRNLDQMIFECSYIIFLSSTYSWYRVFQDWQLCVFRGRILHTLRRREDVIDEWDRKEVAFHMEGFT